MPKRPRRRKQQPLPTYDTQAMRCRVMALEHEYFRACVQERRNWRPRPDRLMGLLAKAYLAAEGLVIRTKITNYPDWRNPVRQSLGPRRSPPASRNSKIAQRERL